MRSDDDMTPPLTSLAPLARPRRRRPLAIVTAAVLAVAATGCGSGDSSAADEAENPYGPLAELLGWAGESPEESRRKQLAVEELVAECMREEGWEYVPVDHLAQAPDDELVELWSDPQAYGERYGYGVVHNYEQWEEPSLLGEDTDDAGGMFEDPNWEYVSDLSETEMEAYYATLYGGAMMVEEAWPEDDDGDSRPSRIDMMSQDRGCQGRASDEVYGNDPLMADPDLAQRLEDHWTNTGNDQRLIDAHAEWVECMGDAIVGAAIADRAVVRPDQMYQYVEQLKYEAMGLEAVPYRDGDDVGMNFYSAWSDETGEGIAVIGEPEPIGELALEQLRTAELLLWGEDQACQDEASVKETLEQIELELVDELRRDFPELGNGS